MGIIKTDTIVEAGTLIKGGERATVRLVRRAQCGSCKACGMLGNHLDLVVENSLGAKQGDLVEISITPTTDRVFAVIVYLIPIIFMGLGLMTGVLCGLKDYFVALIGFGFLAAGLVLAFFIDKYRSKKLNLNPKILKILEVKGEGNEQSKGNHGTAV